MLVHKNLKLQHNPRDIEVPEEEENKKSQMNSNSNEFHLPRLDCNVNLHHFVMLDHLTDETKKRRNIKIDFHSNQNVLQLNYKRWRLVSNFSGDFRPIK